MKVYFTLLHQNELEEVVEVPIQEWAPAMGNFQQFKGHFMDEFPELVSQKELF